MRRKDELLKSFDELSSQGTDVDDERIRRLLTPQEISVTSGGAGEHANYGGGHSRGGGFYYGQGGGNYYQSTADYTMGGVPIPPKPKPL